MNQKDLYHTLSHQLYYQKEGKSNLKYVLNISIMKIIIEINIIFIILFFINYHNFC